jgi:hypothetical protein
MDIGGEAQLLACVRFIYESEIISFLCFLGLSESSRRQDIRHFDLLLGTSVFIEVLRQNLY